MFGLKNLGLVLMLNIIFSYSITTGIFQFLKAVGCEIEPQKKRMH